MPPHALAGETRQTDLDLVRRCLAGDRSAQRRLFRAHFDRLYVTLVRVTHDDQEAEDLAQESFYRAFRSLHTFDGRARFQTWLEAIALRVTFRRLRARGRQRAQLARAPIGWDGEGAPNLDGGAGPGPEDAVQAREGLRRLHALLDRMSPGMRMAFVLHAVDGRPLNEVARLLGIPVVTAKLRAWRARNALSAAARRDEVLAAYLEWVARPGEQPTGATVAPEEQVS